MIKRFGETPKPGTRYVQRTGAYAILALGADLLLTEQLCEEPEIQLPGGGVDPGESPIVALHREVMEETGWRIGSPRRLGAYRRFTYMPEYDMWAEKLCLIYLARPAYRLGPPTEPGHSALWMSAPDAAIQLHSPGDRHFASAFARQVTPISR